MNKKELENEKMLADLRHKYAMDELKYNRETRKCVHQWNLELLRIKNAEYRKNMILRSHHHGSN